MAAISEELLDKFLKGLCTKEEAEAVEVYFEEHPEDLSLIDDYEGCGESLTLPEGYSDEMLEMIVRDTRPEAVKKRGRLAAPGVWAAAASVILVFGTMYLLHRVARTRGEVIGQEAAVWVGKHNADTKKIRIQLPDSSETILSPGATIVYRKDFGSYDKREVKVEGKVVFSVHKNKEMPFIVYSEGVKTTVLGTIFEVTDEKDSSQIRVKLLQGKVMVSVDSIVADSIARYFLSPGEEFVYGKWNKSVVIRDFNVRSGAGLAVNRVHRLPGKPDTLFNWYMFNDQKLADVFDQLSILYNVDIQYSSVDLHNKYFIGKLEKKDSLNKIIRDIALLNHLSVTERDGSYMIRKRRP